MDYPALFQHFLTFRLRFHPVPRVGQDVAELVGNDVSRLRFGSLADRVENDPAPHVGDLTIQVGEPHDLSVDGLREPDISSIRCHTDSSQATIRVQSEGE